MYIYTNMYIYIYIYIYAHLIEMLIYKRTKLPANIYIHTYYMDKCIKYLAKCIIVRQY